MLLLIVLVREFESRRGEIWIYLRKKKEKKDQLLLRAPTVGNTIRRESVREESSELKKYCRDKNARNEP